MKVVPIKSKWVNIPGQKKVRIITKGKQYDVIENYSNIKMIGVIDDHGYHVIYNKSEFIKISEIRNLKLESIGI